MMVIEEIRKIAVHSLPGGVIWHQHAESGNDPNRGSKIVQSNGICDMIDEFARKPQF